MKLIGTNIRSLAIICGFIASLNFVHAQTTARQVQSVSAGNMGVLSVLDQPFRLAHFALASLGWALAADARIVRFIKKVHKPLAGLIR